VGAGDVLFHGALDAHLDRFRSAGAHILNLVLPDPAPVLDIGRIRDADAVARAAEHDPIGAGEQLRRQICALHPVPSDWPDALARRLLEDPGCRLDEWADDHGLSAATVSRGFGKVFGITPAAFRMEARTRRALRLLGSGGASLVAVADAAGFADQAHMCRAVRALTGLPPAAWRRAYPLKPAAARTG
jgi:AraC-like DNA-binding protein